MTASASPRFRCPLIFVVAGLVAIFLLGIENSAMPFATVLAALFVAPYMISLRIPDSGVVIWSTRAVVVLAAFLATRNSDVSAGDVADPHFVIVLGEIFAAEMVMQCWRVKPTGRPPGMGLILFAGIAFMGATFVSDDGLIPYAAPAFFALLVLSWRRIEAQTLHDPMSLWARVIYLIGIAGAIGFGGLTYWTVTSQHDKLNQMFLNVPSRLSQTGMGDQPQLGTTFNLQGSPQRVLLLSGDPGDPHLRGLAFSDYAGGAWGPSVAVRNTEHLPEVIGGAVSQLTLIRVDKLAYASGFIYYPLDTGYIDTGKNGTASWSPSDSGPIRSLTPVPSAYWIAPAHAGNDLVDSPRSNKNMARELAIPKVIDRRVLTLAKALIVGKANSDSRVQAICARLDADHSYSLGYAAGPGDPISDFILSKKSANCEYFASAAVIMLRCIGIPARYVIGYYAHEHNADASVTVRQHDAHAWAEAYYDGAWQTVDATPAAGRPDELYGPTPIWQVWFEDIQNKIAYFQDLAQRVGRLRIATIAGVLIGVYFLLRLLFKELLKRRSGKSSTPFAETMLASAIRFERFLQSNAIVVPTEATWTEYLESLDDLPFNREKALGFIEEYNAVRFGQSADARLTAMLDELEAAPWNEERV